MRQTTAGRAIKEHFAKVTQKQQKQKQKVKQDLKTIYKFRL